MSPIHAELFATKQELAEVVVKSAVDKEELHTEHNKLRMQHEGHGEQSLLLRERMDHVEKLVGDSAEKHNQWERIACSLDRSMGSQQKQSKTIC